MVNDAGYPLDPVTLSKIECGLVLPTAGTAAQLASSLFCAVSDLFEPCDSFLIEVAKTAQGFENPPPEVTFLVQTLGKGKANSIKRDALARKTGWPDRQLRKVIEDARSHGFPIINDSDGKGYYLASDDADIMRQYRTDHARAMRILTRLSKTRHYLREVNYVEA